MIQPTRRVTQFIWFGDPAEGTKCFRISSFSNLFPQGEFA
jgi:hypothetical protein